MRKWLYLEYCEPILDYFDSLESKEVFHDWFLPTFITILSYFLFREDIKVDTAIKVVGELVSVLAILIGFSITCLTLLVASNAERITELRSTHSGKTIRNKEATLFQLLLVNLSFVLIVEFACLAFSIFILVARDLELIKSCFIGVFFFVGFFAIQAFFLNIRNVTNLYFVFYKPDKKEP